MESKDELKETDLKNRTCYYFDDIIKGIGIYFSNILLDEKLCETFQFMKFCKILQVVQSIAY